MALKYKRTAAAIVALATMVISSVAHGDFVTLVDAGWVIHNNGGGATIDTGTGTTSSPALTPGDNITVMAPFSPISLASDGDFITLTTTLSMAGRSTTGVNTLNTQLRFGLFNGPAGPVMADDTSNVGFAAQYANASQTHLKVFAPSNGAATDPLVSGSLGAVIGDVATHMNVTADPENDSIQGANPSAFYELTLTRNAGKLDITGEISGGNYLSSFNVLGFNSVTFPMDGPFSFNRLGFFLGDNVNAAGVNGLGGATFANVTITTNVAAIPESRFGILAVALLLGIVTTGLKVFHVCRRRGQPQP